MSMKVIDLNAKFECGNDVEGENTCKTLTNVVNITKMSV